MPVEIMSMHRSYNRNYDPDELLGEIKNLIRSGDYEDYMFVAAGRKRSIRIGSTDKDLRVGDLLFLNQLIKDDIMGL